MNILTIPYEQLLERPMNYIMNTDVAKEIKSDICPATCGAIGFGSLCVLKGVSVAAAFSPASIVFGGIVGILIHKSDMSNNITKEELKEITETVLTNRSVSEIKPIEYGTNTHLHNPMHEMDWQMRSGW